MKRPLALIGLTSMTVLAVCFYADFKISLMLFVLAAVGFGVSLAVKRLRKEVSPAAFFATVMLSVIGFNMFTAYQVLPVQNKFLSISTVPVISVDKDT